MQINQGFMTFIRQSTYLYIGQSICSQLIIRAHKRMYMPQVSVTAVCSTLPLYIVNRYGQLSTENKLSTVIHSYPQCRIKMGYISCGDEKESPDSSKYAVLHAVKGKKCTSG